MNIINSILDFVVCIVSNVRSIVFGETVNTTSMSTPLENTPIDPFGDYIDTDIFDLDFDFD